jgi:hypothetical protein
MFTIKYLVSYLLCSIALRSERGSLALEQVLFIGAVVALAAGLFAFYDNLAAYFSGIGFADSPNNFGGAGGLGSGGN